MINEWGEKFSILFKKSIPDAFVFALALTCVTAFASIFLVGASISETIYAWYDGFWLLLEFGMQMVLILITGYSIALSPQVKKYLSRITLRIKTPNQVYPFIIVVGLLLSLVSWGWVVITAVLARDLALRIKGINYPYLVACVYFSGSLWVNGLSSTIPLLLNTEQNYLIEASILSETIPTNLTLGSFLNIFMAGLFLIIGPLLFYFLRPEKPQELREMFVLKDFSDNQSIKEEAQSMQLPTRSFSDTMNNSPLLQFVVGIMALGYLFFHFESNGFELNLNIMILIFISLGLFLHRSPIRYGIAMKRASSNISGILFQFPFYAGIMGIMINTDLGHDLAIWMSSNATVNTYPLFAFLSGAVVNFAIPSAGGEFAVIGPSILNAVKNIGVGFQEAELTEMISRAALATAYGETLTNSLQPFYLLIIIPIMGAGTNIQARDVMGFLFIPFLIFFILTAIAVTFLPI
jgi:short-chain fatty acids transporter